MKSATAGRLEVYGYVEGDIAAGNVLVHQGGRCYGTIKSENADVHGEMQGDVVVKHLINIRSSGSVSGNVRYGKLALEQGGNLSAEVRNVPPSLSRRSRPGGRPRQVRAHHAAGSHRARSRRYGAEPHLHGLQRPQRLRHAGGRPRARSRRFTQADLAGGKVSFMHDGTNTQAASFDVIVADRSGATSGAAQTVKVAVSG